MKPNREKHATNLLINALILGKKKMAKIIILTALLSKPTRIFLLKKEDAKHKVRRKLHSVLFCFVQEMQSLYMFGKHENNLKSILCWEWFQVPNTLVFHTTSRFFLLPAWQIQSLSPANQDIQDIQYSVHCQEKTWDTAGLRVHLLCRFSPECSRGGQWEGFQVSDLCKWDLANVGIQMSALSGQHKIVRVVHWQRRREKHIQSQPRKKWKKFLNRSVYKTEQNQKETKKINPRCQWWQMKLTWTFRFFLGVRTFLLLERTP